MIHANPVRVVVITAMLLFTLLSGCASSPEKEMPITTVEYVDLERFAGRWYVIANIPTFVEKNAYNAIEHYAVRDADTIDTTFSFNKGGFDGKRKSYTPVASVRPNTGNAVWGMQFIWPFKLEYRVLWLNDDYSVTVVGRSKRDYVWVMARSPQIDSSLREEIWAFLAREGYDLQQIQNVPQQWD
ncbi:MAG: lipocalin family protein [Pseudomonadota bacterium]